MSRVEYQIPNISCGHCVHTIQSEVGELEGVLLVNADQETQMVTIDYQPPADEQQIVSLLKAINYAPANLN